MDLKKSFERFRQGVEEKVFGPVGTDQLTTLCKRFGILEPESGVDPTGTPMIGEPDFVSLLDRLGETPLNREQNEMVNLLKGLAKKTMGPLGPDTKDSTSDRYQFIERDLTQGTPQEQIGLKSVLEECMGQMDLMEEVVRMFNQNLVEFIGCAKVQLATGDLANLGLACQKVIPSLRMIKSYGLLETAQQMSVHCRTDMDRRHLEFLYDQFVMEFPGIQQQVDFEMELLRTM